MQYSRSFSRSLDELPGIVSFAHDFMDRESIDPSLHYVVDLCVEELFVNMVKYNTETGEDIRIGMQPHARGVEVSLTDFDVDRFDPQELRTVDVNAPLGERDPGGLGLYLVLKMADSIHYEYRDRTSRITFIASRKQDHDAD